MTTKADEEAMALIADMRHWAQECSDDTSEVRLTRSDVLHMADVFEHARQWHRLTEDPATWPEEAPCLFVRVRSGCVLRSCIAEGNVRMVAEHYQLEGWTHWQPVALPLPPPPEGI
ncbi:MAG: hypothetical protein KGL39_24735 [Patescibacteria group bacterium]|nr:hypothetical protein [Patescibacteria group bacterium]